MIKKNCKKPLRIPRVDESHTAMNYIRMLAPGLLNGMWQEYRFCAVIVGDGPGVRKRLKDAGLRDWRFDFAWPDSKKALEIDGGQWMAGGGRHNTDGDREKLNTAARIGWAVMRISVSEMKRDPAKFVDNVRFFIQGTKK
jgi:hypothetical protein